MEQRKTYISGPLQAVEDIAAARTLYEFLADICRSCGWQAYVPHQHTDPIHHRSMSNVDVFNRDFEAIIGADAIVAYIGQPSSGVGAELGIAFAIHKPIIALYREHDVPSRFLLGMLQHSRHCTVFKYSTIGECRSMLVRGLETLMTP
jgi:nucleoside 2-deoxyribosyltransferase